jgi:hypothetical protein
LKWKFGGTAQINTVEGESGLLNILCLEGIKIGKYSNNFLYRNRKLFILFGEGSNEDKTKGQNETPQAMPYLIFVARPALYNFAKTHTPSRQS